ncbi:TonB-linked outer membrane protein, SusC/RagA family [bacterium A37T11]|nr:TonB-linked outer membrane protein, SusC/RagA family [bacterium A37T11]
MAVGTRQMPGLSKWYYLESKLHFKITKQCKNMNIIHNRVYFNIFLAMKLTVLLTFFLSIQVSAMVFSQHITLSARKMDLQEVMQQIRQQSGYSFLFDEESLKLAHPVTADLKQSSLDAALTAVFKDQPFNYEVRGKMIVVLPKIKFESQQAGKLSGVVVGAQTNLPINGVNIYLRGNSLFRSTITNGQGRYQITGIPNGQYSLIFHYMGYRSDTTQITVESEERIVNKHLELAKSALEQVIVIGYGNKNRRDLTSAISSVEADMIQKFQTNVSTFDNLIGGIAKGVNVNQTSGEPGSSARLNIRGITSPLQGNNQPLYVIDGVPFFAEDEGVNPLSNVSIPDILSIDILKDAAATSIYGSRGANGVIIVKTKRGERNEKAQIDVSFKQSVSNSTKEYQPLSLEAYKQLQERIVHTSVDAFNKSPNYLYDSYGTILELVANIEPLSGTDDYSYIGLKEEAFGTTYTNWNNLIRNKNAFTSAFNTGITGGSDQTNYAFSFNSLNQDGLYINDNYKKYGSRIVLDSYIKKHIKIGASLGYTYSKRHDGRSNNESNELKPWLVRPDVDPYDENGNINYIDGSLSNGGAQVLDPSPLLLLQNDNNHTLNQFSGNAYAEYEVLKDLKLRGDISLNHFLTNQRVFEPLSTKGDYSALGYVDYAQLYIEDYKTTNSSVNFRIDYQRNIQKHQFNFMAGIGFDRYFQNYTANEYENFPDDKVLTNASSAGSVVSYSENSFKRGLNSLYSRLSYKYGEKYLAEINFRTDRSSKFGPGNQRANFPSVSLGWRVSEEGFLRAIKTIDDLKLRMSLGATGSTNVADFLYLQSFNRGSSDYWGGEPGIVIASTLPNRDIGWEKTKEYNFGLDFTLFSHVLKGSLDYYYRYTTGALANAPAPLESGSTAYSANLLDLSNKGFELEMSYNILKNKDFQWNIGLNIAHNKNIIDNINGANLSRTSFQIYTEGHPPGEARGFRVEKIFNSQNEVDALNEQARASGHSYYDALAGADLSIGDYKYVDLNHDGFIDLNDQEGINDPNPDFFGGIFTSISFQQFNLSMAFQYSKGAEIVMQDYINSAVNSLGLSQPAYLVENSWTPENPNSLFSRQVLYDIPYNSRTNDRFVFDASYLRLKNIGISYRFSKYITSKLHVNNLSLSASLSNVFTISSWPGIDPELINGSWGSLSFNSDPYPLARTMTIGLDLSF